MLQDATGNLKAIMSQALGGPLLHASVAPQERLWAGSSACSGLSAKLFSTRAALSAPGRLVCLHLMHTMH